MTTYCACWTDSDCLLSCWHEHSTIEDATNCFACAGAYVVAIEDGVIRALTPLEATEEERAKYALLSDGVVPILPSPGLAQVPEPLPSARVHWRKGEGLFEFVNRVMDHYSYPEVSAPDPLPRRSAVALMLLIDFLDAVLKWIGSWEVDELERIHAKQVPTWLEDLRDRARCALEHDYR